MKPKHTNPINGLNQMEAALMESEEMIRFLFGNNPQPMWIYDLETLNFLEVNAAAINHYGYSKEEFMGMTIKDIRPFEDIPRLLEDVGLTIQTYNPAGEWRHVKKNGQMIFVEITSHSVSFNGRNARHVLVKDITSSKQAESKVQQVSRLYALLSQINQAIVHIKDQDQLFLKICQVAIDFGHFRMAWIGLVDEAQARLIPIVHAGHEDGYLDQITIRTDDVPFGQGPIGQSFREGTIISSFDIATDPAMIPWRDKGLERGYRSLASVPFRRKGKTVGTLSIYSSDPGFFTADEQTLLQEIGGNISFALDAMDSESERNKAEKALHESEVKYRSFFENSLDAILLTGSGGRTLSANQAACSMFGYSEEELIRLGKSGIEDETDPRLSRVLAERNLKGKAQGEVSFKRKGGTCFPADISTTAIKNAEGIERSSLIIRDITERKEEEETLQKLSSAVKQTFNSILITDLQGRIEYVNPAFEALSGFSYQEALGKTPRILKSGMHGQEYYSRMWNTILSGDVFRTEMVNRKKTGELFYMQKHISPILDKEGSITHLVSVGVDTTDRKMAEKELIRAKEKAEESDRLKSAFLANMSHEVRTPLNSIIGFSELLTDPGFDEEQKNEFIHLIVTSGNNLLTIISDIMDLSKIESGETKLHFSSMNALKFISGIKKQFSLQAKGKKLELKLTYSETDQETVIVADADRLRQIFNNLVVNAMKFTTMGSIEMGYQPRGHLVEFFVRDTGIGIPTPYHDTIFDRFRQVEDAQTRTFGGNGLGLAISKNLVKLMGGEIWVESEPGKGSTFYFTIPAGEGEKVRK